MIPVGPFGSHCIGVVALCASLSACTGEQVAITKDYCLARQEAVLWERVRIDVVSEGVDVVCAGLLAAPTE